MKKLFLFILAAGALATSFAQSGYGRNNRNVYGENNRRYDDRDGLDRRERDAQIERINRSYNVRIDDAKSNRWLRAAEKRRQIRSLEVQRDAEIRRMADRYNDRNKGYYDTRYSKNNRRF